MVELLGGYPVNLDVAGRPVLVVGGGPVAGRKAAGLVAAGASVTVVAPEVGDVVEGLIEAGAVTHLRRRYAPGDARRHRLVITATGVPEVDASVAADADAAGVWVNSADDQANCSFILPAIFRDGPVSVAVSTSGASPALASWLRDQLSEATSQLLGGGVADLAGLLSAARAQVKASGRSSETIDWRSLLDGPLPGLVRAGRLGDAQSLLDGAIG